MKKAIDADARTVRVGVSSEEPVKRSFGMEVIDHSRESMNLDFLNSGRAPLLLDHDMERQIGVVESVELDEDARRSALSFALEKATGLEIFNDVSDGIRQNISVGYRVDGRVEREDDGERHCPRLHHTNGNFNRFNSCGPVSLVGVGRSISNLYTQPQRSSKAKDEMSDIDLDAVRAEAATPRRKAPKIMTLARKHSRADLGECHWSRRFR